MKANENRKDKMSANLAASIFESIDLSEGVEVVGTGSNSYENDIVTEMVFFYESLENPSDSSRKGLVTIDLGISEPSISVTDATTGEDIGSINKVVLKAIQNAYLNILLNEPVPVVKKTPMDKIVDEVEGALKGGLTRISTLANTVRVEHIDHPGVIAQKDVGSDLWSVTRDGDYICGMETLYDAFRVSELVQEIQQGKGVEKGLHYIVVQNDVGPELMTQSRLMQYAQNVIEANSELFEQDFPGQSLKVTEVETAIDTIECVMNEEALEAGKYLTKVYRAFEEDPSDESYTELKTAVDMITPVLGFNEVYSVVNSANYCEFSEPTSEMSR